MKKKLETAIETMAEKAKKTDSSIEAQQYAQAVLNMTNALVALRLNPDKG